VVLIEGEEHIYLKAGKSDVVIEARTSSAGSGYHRWLCETLHRMSTELGFGWQGVEDETGYWETQRTDRLELEMTSWLKKLAEVTVEQGKSGASLDGLNICMPTQKHYHGVPGPRTQLGHRDLAWFEQVMATGDGSDFWIWPEYGTGPSFLVGQAKVLMSLEVRWREPLMDEEGALLKRVDRLLEEARQFDAKVPVPAREWVEIRGFLGLAVSDALRQEADAATGPLLGYHRYPFTFDVSPSWSIRLEGQMAMRPNQEEGSFEAFDANSWIGVSPKTRTDPNGEITRTKFEEVPLPDPRLTGSAGIAWNPENGGRWILASAIARGTKVVIVTIVRSVETDKQWVIDTFGGVRFKGE